MEAFERACQLADGATKLAEVMTKLSEQVLGKPDRFYQSRVSNWKTTGVPVDYVILVSAAVGYQVTPHELARVQYPHPSDGLPAELRVQAAE